MNTGPISAARAFRRELAIAVLLLSAATFCSSALLGPQSARASGASNHAYDSSVASTTTSTNVASATAGRGLEISGSVGSVRVTPQSFSATEDSSNVVYRYMSDGEKAAVEKSGYVPSTDVAGNLRSVFYSPDEYSSASEAEQALQIGSENPAGPTASPTWRVTASPEGADWSYGGNVEGGSGVEMLTENPLRALSWEPLEP